MVSFKDQFWTQPVKAYWDEVRCLVSDEVWKQLSTIPLVPHDLIVTQVGNPILYEVRKQVQ